MSHSMSRLKYLPGARLKKAQQTFNDGETIFREGEASDRAFEIVSGNVEIVKRGDDGAVRLALLSAGEIFGEMGILDDGKRSATAKAVGTVTAFVISREDFLTGVRDKPELALSVLSNLTRGKGRRRRRPDPRPCRRKPGTGVPHSPRPDFGRAWWAGRGRESLRISVFRWRR